MCLITNQLEPLIATEDIKVGKILSEKRNSLFHVNSYHGFHYDYGVPYMTEIRDTDDYSAFTTIDMEYLYDNYPKWRLGEENLKYIGQGFHSLLIDSPIYLDNLEYSPSEIMYHATIPKGSEYYIGFCGLVVSNKIIVYGTFH